MDQIEQDLPIELIFVGFAVLLISSTIIRNKLRTKFLISEGQIINDKGRIPSIEERVAGNKQWKSGKIRSKGIGLVIALWLVTIVWSLTLGVPFIKSFSNPEAKTGQIVILGIFSLAAFVFAYFAIRFTIRQFRFGQSTCHIHGKAGVLGKTMTGVVRTINDIKPTGDYTITLQCLESYTVGTGKNRRTETKLHWEGKHKTPKLGQSSRIGIPFSFTLPEYPYETGYQLARGTITWQLRVDAPVPGVDYAGLFVVPVFKMD